MAKKIDWIEEPKAGANRIRFSSEEKQKKKKPIVVNIITDHRCSRATVMRNGYLYDFKAATWGRALSGALLKAYLPHWASARRYMQKVQA